MSILNPQTHVSFFNGETHQRGRVIADLGAKIQICSAKGMHLIDRQHVTREQANNPIDILNDVFGAKP